MKPGTVLLERYRIEALIGQGGMGSIFRARDQTDQLVAIKCIRSDRRRAGKGDKTEQRFAREVSMLDDLQHPAIVACLDHGITDDGQLFLVMEWLEGITLEDRLQEGPLTVRETLQLGARIAGALGVAHARGMVHRDVKPANIFLSHSDPNRAKLLDFGAGRWDSANTLTVAGAQIGTPSYMAPEQIRSDGEIDGAADVFALGSLLYECLSGHMAFTAAQVMAVLYMILIDDPPPISQLVDGVPPALEELLAHTLAKDPKKRPANGTALAERLSAIPLPDAGQAPKLRIRGNRVDREKPQRRLICVVLVGGRVSFDAWLIGHVHGVGGLSHNETLPDFQDPLARIRRRFQSVGARFDRLGDGSLIAIMDAPADTPERAQDAARCARALHTVYPDKPIAVATGQALMTRTGVLGEIIDRAISLLPRPKRRAKTKIRVDRQTAELIGEHFALQHGDDEIVLLDERKRILEPTLLGRPSPFVGRDSELALLTSTLRACISESSARAIVLSGPVGIGKSRLVREFMRAIIERHPDIEIWRGHSQSHQTDSTLATLAQLILGTANVRADEPLALRQQKLQMRVSRYLPAGEVSHVARFLGELVGAPWADDDSLQLRAARADGQLMSDRMSRAVTDFARAETSVHPLVVVLEDCHLSDRTSVTWLGELVRKLQDRPLLLLAVGRDRKNASFTEMWSKYDPMNVSLQPLSPPACEQLARAVVTGDDLEKKLPSLLARAQGNPLVLEEALRCLQGQREYAQALPALLTARFQTLPTAARQYLQAASVFGNVFWRQGVDTLLGAQPGDHPLSQLLAEEFLVRQQGTRFTDLEEVSFRHSAIRAVAYRSLEENERRHRYRLTGEWLQLAGERDAAVLAGYFERGGQPERAVQQFAIAAHWSLQARDLAGALAMADCAVSCGAAGEALGHLRAIEAEAHYLAGEYKQALAAGEQALSLLPAGQESWYRLAGVVADTHALQGHAEALGQRALQLGNGPTDGGDHQGWYRLATRVARRLFFMGRFSAGRKLLARIEQEKAYSKRDAPAVAAALHVAKAARALADGDISTQLREYRKAATCYEIAGDLRRAFMQMAHAGIIRNQLGLYQLAESTLRSTLERVQKTSLDEVADQIKSSLCHTLASRGQMDEARALAEETASSLAARGDARNECLTRIYLSRALEREGQLDLAEEQARSALALCPNLPATRVFALATLAQVLLRREQPDRAMFFANAAWTVLQKLDGVDEGELQVHVAYAEALHAAGQTFQARELIIQARDRLLERAAKIGQEAWRESFLHNVAEHARTLHLATLWSDSDS